MSSVQVYTSSKCPYSLLAKKLLSSKGIIFIEINVDGKKRELKELKERTGSRDVPKIFIDGEMIGGFQDLAALDLKGELDAIK